MTSNRRASPRGAHWLVKNVVGVPQNAVANTSRVLGAEFPRRSTLYFRARSSGVEHTLDKRGVVGSKPTGPTSFVGP